jgi:RNA polymerase sigma factor (sigma-70 family)
LDNKSQAYTEMLNANKGIIYKITNAYCKDTESRKDVIQEIFIQLWKSFDQYNSQYKQSTWIYRIALNVAISSYRKEYRRSSIALPLDEDINPAIEVKDTQDEQVAMLYNFIGDLKEIDKAIMILYLEEKNHNEIADIMGITETNVATKISRLKSTLATQFTKYKNK